MHLLFKNAKDTFYLNEISSKNFKFLDVPRFNSCISISYIIKKITKKFHYNLSFEVYKIFFKLCDKYYFLTNILHTFRFFHYFLDYVLNYSSILKTSKNSPRCDVHTLHKQLIAK
jgi:hypothetical protein